MANRRANWRDRIHRQQARGPEGLRLAGLTRSSVAGVEFAVVNLGPRRLLLIRIDV